MWHPARVNRRKWMRGFVALAALMVSSSVFGQECIRPEWGKCVSFPNGGSHTGTSIQKEKIQAEVAPGPDICVINEEEIGGYTFARFGRNGAPWPNADWAANVDDFCFFKK
jgi:hypothetical protein